MQKNRAKQNPIQHKKEYRLTIKNLPNFLLLNDIKRAKLLSFFDTQKGYSFGNENLKIKGNASRQNGQL